MHLRICINFVPLSLILVINTSKRLLITVYKIYVLKGCGIRFLLVVVIDSKRTHYGLQDVCPQGIWYPVSLSRCICQ